MELRVETTAPNAAAGRHASKGTRILLWMLLLLAAGEFVVRGPLRFPYSANWNDLAQNYAATRLWLRGQNFVRPENFASLWEKEVHATLNPGTIRTHIAPPPGTLVLLAPIAVLPWNAAKVAWVALLVAAAGTIIWSLARLVGFTRNEPTTYAFVAFCLALAPLHTGIASGNETIIVVALCTLGILAASEGRDVVAGVMFGAACSLKPHIAAFLLLYYLVRQRWRLLTTSVAFAVLLFLVATLRMQIAGVSWVHDYFHNIQVLSANNKIDDFTSANPIRFLLINLQVLFYSYTSSATSANILALTTGVLLIAIWIYLTVRETAKEAEVLALSAIAVIGLLPVYHRFYDASILAIPVCWCMSELTGEKRRIARIALFLMVPFLFPGAAVLQQLARNGRIPASWLSAWWWQGLVMPHQTWFLLLLVLVLLYALHWKHFADGLQNHLRLEVSGVDDGRLRSKPN
jgi:Glycosyltransferase family 87